MRGQGAVQDSQEQAVEGDQIGRRCFDQGRVVIGIKDCLGKADVEYRTVLAADRNPGFIEQVESWLSDVGHGFSVVS